MKLPFEYRSYLIDREDGWYVAKSIDGEPCEIGSRHLFRVMRAVDALWEALETGEDVPSWLTAEGVVNLDQPVRDRLRLFTPFLRLTQRFSAAPSQVDPPPTWATTLMIVSAIGLALPIAFLAQQQVRGLEPEIIFTLLVMAFALRCGTASALVVSALSALSYNFCCQPPSLQLTTPGWDEIIYLGINVGLSVLLPWLFGRPRCRFTRSPESTASDHIRDTA